MVWSTSRFLTAASLVLRLLKALIPVSILWVSKLIIDQIVLAIGEGEASTTLIWQYLALELALAVANDLLTRSISLCDSLLGDRFTNAVSVRLVLHASRLDLAAFEDPGFYDKLERARRQTTSRLGMLGELSTIAQDLVTLLSLAGGMLWFSPWLLGLLIVAVMPAFLGETHFAGLSYSLLFWRTPQRRELDYLRMLGASHQSAKEVKIFGLGHYLADRYRRVADSFYEENKKLAVRRASVGALLSLIGTAGYYLAYFVIIGRTLSGELSVGDLSFLVGAFARSRTLMEGIFASLTRVSEQALFLTDLYDFFRLQPRMVSPPNAIPAPRPIQRGFEFQDVSFHYPGTEIVVLENITFHLEPGEKMALIGENGAGKTTLVKLLARLYDPDGGRILLDGRDLREYDVEDLRREIGVIFQDYMRFDLLARENIGFGRIEQEADLERIQASAVKSLADDVIRRLPKGYRQMLGRRFEDGVDLSSGQWQKIALARAYMRDAQVLILDEPTASLDARAEYEVFQRFADLTSGKMAVLISHRFSTVRMADRILVLEHGRILEEGTHEELVAKQGRYSELFELQAAGYR